MIVESGNLVGQWATHHRRHNLEVFSPNMPQWSQQEVCDAISLVEGSWLSMAFLYLLVILPSSCWMCVDTGCISGSIGASCGGCSRQVHALRVDLWHAEIHFESFWFLQFGWLFSKQSYREWTKSCPCVMIFTCWFGIGFTRAFAMKCKVTAARLWKPIVKLCCSTCMRNARAWCSRCLPWGSFWVIYMQRGLAHTHTHMWMLNLNSHPFLCMLYICYWWDLVQISFKTLVESMVQFVSKMFLEPPYIIYLSWHESYFPIPRWNLQLCIDFGTVLEVNLAVTLQEVMLVWHDIRERCQEWLRHPVEFE